MVFVAISVLIGFLIVFAVWFTASLFGKEVENYILGTHYRDIRNWVKFVKVMLECFFFSARHCELINESAEFDWEAFLEIFDSRLPEESCQLFDWPM